MKFFMKHQKKILAALAILLALLMLLPTISMIVSSAFAVTPEEIQALKDQAAALAQEKKDLSNELAALEGEIDSAYAKKLVVEQEINVVTEQIATTEGLILQYDGLIAQEEVNLANAQEEEARHFEEFCQRVRIMEEEGTASYWEIIFNAADFTDLLDRTMMVSEVVEYDNAVMAALEQARIDVENAKAALEGARAEQVSAKEALAAQQAELDAKMATIEELLAELEERQEVYEAQIQHLENVESEMDDEIAAKQAELERQIAAQRAAAAAAAAASQIQVDTGSGYVWPLDGCYVITSLFGGRTHPITGLADNHRGVDVRASYGTPIKAARGGTVITSTYNRSYGNYVVVSHYNGDSTLYAHMSKRGVSEGDTVAQGEVVGYVGSTGSSSGNHLHFEVRVGGQRADPVNYYPNLNLWITNDGEIVPLPH